MTKKTLKELREMTMKEIVAFAVEWGVKVDKKGSKTSAIGKIEAYCPEAINKAETVTETVEVNTAETEAATIEVVPATEAVVPAKKEKKKKAKNPERIAFTEKIKKIVEESGGEFRTWEKLPSIFLIKMQKKSIVEVRYGKDGYKMAINPNRVQIGIPTKTIKYYLKALTDTIVYTDTKELEAIIGQFKE